MICSWVFNTGLWRCSTEIEGERICGIGRTPVLALQDLECKLLGIDQVYFVHMNVVLD